MACVGSGGPPGGALGSAPMGAPIGGKADAPCGNALGGDDASLRIRMCGFVEPALAFFIGIFIGMIPF